MTITAATKWASNADMILDIVELGYIKPTDSIIDLTYGGGKWWTKYQHPGLFIANTDDDNVEDHGGTSAYTTFDYRHIDHEITGEPFDVVVFDPPYVSMGGRATSGLPDFMDRYGLENAASSPERLQVDNELGLREAMRITRPGGLILAKCAPYISSGVRKDGDWWARDAALAMGLTIQDMLIHIGDVRAQPKDGPCRKCAATGINISPVSDDACMKCGGTGRIPRKVKHARNNYSVLFIFGRPKPRRRASVPSTPPEQEIT